MYIDNIDYTSYELLSLDIFDTLLLRAVAKPTDIFKEIWKKIKKENLYLIDLSDNEFSKIRIEMEITARNKVNHKEINLDDIYKELPSRLVKNINRLKEIEIETEIEYCYINADIYELVKKFNNDNKKVILLSDMYLSKNQIERMLTENHFDMALIDELIISNEYKCSKHNGELYNILLTKYNHIPIQSIIHIGDNKLSDYNNALSFGIQAVHYDIIPNKLKDIYEYEKIRHNIPQKEILSLRKLAAKSKVYDEQWENTLYTIGASITGPFLTMFIHWVCDRLEESKIKRIYPFMREGYLLGELIKNECSNRGLDILIKPIYISRIASYIPSIEKIDKEEIENLIGVRNLTIEKLFISFGLDFELFAELSQYKDIRLKVTHEINFNEQISLKEYIINRLLDSENIKKINSYIEQQRRLFITYLKQEIKDFDNIATIDIGYVGRIQQCMEKALNIEEIPHKIKHFCGLGVTGEKVFNGMDFEGYYSTFNENHDLMVTILRTTDIMDKLISVTEGSTIGYKHKDNCVVPVKDSGLSSSKFQDIVFEGIQRFQNYWFDFKKKKPQLVSKIVNNKRETLKIFHRLIDMPTLSEAHALSGMEADTNFGTNYTEKIITEENIELLHLKGIEFVDRCNVSYGYENSNIAWPKGLITLEDEYYYLRKALKGFSKNEIMKSMQEVVERVQAQDIKEVALYGAGEHGRQFCFVCELYDIHVNCFIDRKESIWGTKKEGVEIMSLREAVNRGNKTFIITSMFSIPEIRDYIIKTFEETAEKPIIFSA